VGLPKFDNVECFCLCSLIAESHSIHWVVNTSLVECYELSNMNQALIFLVVSGDQVENVDSNCLSIILVSLKE
jgi:hypothetical protein